MTMVESRPPVAPGEPAPDFTLPAIDRSETVSLADYRGRSPLFLVLLIGLWCPFCRRAIAQMAPIEGQLKTLGVETLAIVATTPENARLYFKYRPTRLRLASDPIDRDGIVRWANVEGSEGPAGVGKFPSAQEIMAAARALKN